MVPYLAVILSNGSVIIVLVNIQLTMKFHVILYIRGTFEAKGETTTTSYKISGLGGYVISV